MLSNNTKQRENLIKVEGLLVELEDIVDETDAEIEERWENIVLYIQKLREISKGTNKKNKEAKAVA